MVISMQTYSSINRPRQSGAALVELAIVIPVLLAFFFALADYGRALLYDHVLLNQVESGTRYLGRVYQGLNSSCGTGSGWASAKTTATNLVVYGNEAGSGSPMITGMTTSNVGINVVSKSIAVPGSSPAATVTACTIQVSASVTNPGMFGTTVPLLGAAQPVLRANSEERYVGE